MSLQRRSMELAVDAYRHATGAEADGRASRARVLARVAARARRRVLARRAVFVLATAVVLALSGTAAWTAIGRWSAAREAAVVVPVAAPVAPVAPIASSRVQTPSTDAAPIPAAPMPARSSASEEARVYGRAHAAHFAAGDSRRALALWDAYLARYPSGTFVPEARFNRALCLLRLGRRDEARAALEPFAAGAYGRYRKREAATLLDWTAPALR